MHKIKNTVALISLLAAGQLHAAAYNLPTSSQSIIGSLENSKVKNGDTLSEIAQENDLGYNAIKYANPQLDDENGFKVDSNVLLPTQHLLPEGARRGFVVNLPEMRMYYYPKNSNKVLTYPIGIGKIGRTIPVQQATIVRKKKNPDWLPTKNIREFNLKQGIVLPRVMPPGPDNPLGTYAVYMSIPTYLMHSTIYPESIGQRASFGCFRMYESDIENLFPMVDKGTPVLIIDRPVKIGWQDNKLYMESHHPLEERSNEKDAHLSGMIQDIANMTKNTPTLVDWQAVAYLRKVRDGIPHDIGMKI